MTRESLRKHWDVISFFKEGGDIEERTKTGWLPNEDPSFDFNKEFRKKSEWVPQPFERILVSEDGVRWIERVFVKRLTAGFVCIIENADLRPVFRDNLQNSIMVNTWRYGKKREEFFHN